jgi:hypothetical protein
MSPEGASRLGLLQFWSVIATFALATPVGIGVGVVLSAWTTSNGAAAVSALASGTVTLAWAVHPTALHAMLTCAPCHRSQRRLQIIGWS